MKLSKAVEGFLMDFRAENSERTTILYRGTFKVMIEYLHDPDVETIDENTLKNFMNYVRYDHKPKRFSGDTSPYSPSMVDNYWKGIRSFYRWAEHSLEIKRPDTHLPRPHFKLPVVNAFSESDIKGLLDACTYSAEKAPPARRLIAASGAPGCVIERF